MSGVLMVQGTASSVGKSLLVAALGRMYARRGVAVAPFKAQNMALNAHVTPTGAEIGRAQALQARACGIAPEPIMNPILLKPQADAAAQVVVLGASRGTVGARRYHEDKLELRAIVVESLRALRTRFDVVLIEGAGSPAEINLRDRDLVNMFVAAAADAPVLLVGDIDRGGVFAHLVGTLALLEPADRARVAGFVINRFRGDRALLDPGLRMLEARTGVPVLGVIPHVPRLRLGDEDSLSLDERTSTRRARAHELEIAVVRLPRIANTDDFDALACERDVVVRFVDRPHELEGAALVVLPGTKSTMADLAWLRTEGFAAALERRASRGEAILGICGGCQMLGDEIVDGPGIEQPPGTRMPGLGLLPVRTAFEPVKTTTPCEARGVPGEPWLGSFEGAAGYLLHAGRIHVDGPPLLELRRGGGEWIPEGARAGAVMGTMVHGLLEHEGPRRGLLAHLCAQLGRPPLPVEPIPSLDQELDRWADAVEASLDRDALDRLLDRGLG